MKFEIRMNPNFKAEVIKAAEEKLGAKMIGERLNRTFTCSNGHIFTLRGNSQLQREEVISVACPECEQPTNVKWPMGRPYAVSASS